MARVEPTRLFQEKALPLFSIDAANFVEIIFEKFSEDVSISAKIGDWQTPTRTILENRKDILTHLALLKNSFEMSAGDLEIKLNEIESKITFKESLRATAESIIADLDHYVPLHRRVIHFLSSRRGLLVTIVCLLYFLI
jgi:hypothetical protein